MKGIYEKLTANFILVKHWKRFPKIGNKKRWLLSDLNNGDKYYIHASGDSGFAI